MIIKLNTHMKKITLLTSLLMILWLAVFPQQPGYPCICGKSQETNTRFKPRLKGKTFLNPFKGRSEQYFNDWTRGKVFLKDSTVIEKEYLTYNRYLDELLWLRSKDYQIMVVDKNMVSGFDLMPEDGENFARFARKKFSPWYTSDTTNVYFQVLEAGEPGLYVLRDINYIKNANELELKDRYYLYLDNTYHNFKPNSWNLYRLISGDKDKWFIFQLFSDENIRRMRKIIRSNHLSVKEEKDLVRAVRLYKEQDSTEE